MPEEMIDMVFSSLVEQDGDCANLRLIDSKCKGVIDNRLRSCWERLKKEAPDGPVDLPDLMERIEGEKVQERPILDVNPRFLFQRLAKEFSNLGAVLPVGKLCTTPEDYADLQNQIDADALIAVWMKINAYLKLPIELHAAKEVLAWFENPDNAVYLDCITVLNIEDGNLRHLPDAATKLKQLVFLRVYCNLFTRLPKKISILSQLLVLSFCRNRLSSLPESIGSLSQLQGLHLNRNQIAELPKTIGDLSQLTVLDLDQNRLRSLPGEIGRLSLLQKLYLRGNELTTLPGEIDNLSHLETFHLEDNPLLFVPSKILDSEIGCIKFNQMIVDIKNGLAHSCVSPLGQLYQSIMRNAGEEEIKRRFDCLSEEEKRLIIEIVGSFAGNPLMDECHAFEDMTRFSLAVRRAISALATGLAQEERSLVCDIVYQLSEMHNPSNGIWGKVHAWCNFPLLADALSSVKFFLFEKA